MTHVIVGLGNPGEEYVNSRHNVGRTLVERFGDKHGFGGLEKSKNAQALYSKGAIGKHSVELLLPETYMNKSGTSVKYMVTQHNIKSENVVVVYDDIDLPLGTIKISFGRSSGGHRGVESIMRSIKTKDFVRVRVGVTPATPKGKLKKPKGEDAVIDFLMKAFRKPEQEALKKVEKRVHKVLETIVEEGRQVAMNRYN